MNTTINISLPKSILADAKKIIAKRGFASLSEFIRAAIRKEVYPELTENGFTPEFEAEVLRSAAEPRKNDIVFKNESELHDYFLHLKLPKRYNKKLSNKK